jgi:fumarate hydratase class II
MHSIVLLSDSSDMFTQFCIKDLAADEKRIREFVDNSLMLVTALQPKIGYDKAAEIAHKAWHDGTTLLEATKKLGYLTEAEFKELVQPKLMTAPK